MLKPKQLWSVLPVGFLDNSFSVQRPILFTSFWLRTPILVMSTHPMHWTLSVATCQKGRCKTVEREKTCKRAGAFILAAVARTTLSTSVGRDISPTRPKKHELVMNSSTTLSSKRVMSSFKVQSRYASFRVLSTKHS